MRKEVKLGDILDYEQPSMYIVKNTNYDKTFDTPVLTAGQTFILGYTNEKENIFKAKENPVIIFDDFTTASKYVDFDFKVKSSAMKILKPKEGVNIRYVYYAMKNIKFDNQLHKRYWISEYSKIKLLIPDIKMQEKIVKELELINKLLDYKKKQIELFDDFIKSQFVEMFEDIKIKEKVKNVSVYFSRGKTPNYVEKSNIKVISQACIYWDEFKYEKAKYQDENKALKSLEKTIENGDVLITSTGTGTLGRCNVYYGEEHKYMADSHVSILRFNYKEMNPIFFKYYFMQEKVQKELYAECVNGSTNQIELSKDRFLNFRILIPEITLQNQFSEIVKQIDKQKFESMIQLKMMEKIYNIINDRRRYV